VTIDTQASCLAIYPLPEWERVEKDIQGLPTLNPAVKRFQRLVLGYASDLELDGNGRVLLPAPLREYARLEKRAVLVGQGNKLELWSDELWASECEEALTAGEAEMPSELMELKL
jgi:MraZ protein